MVERAMKEDLPRAKAYKVATYIRVKDGDRTDQLEDYDNHFGKWTAAEKADLWKDGD